MGNEKNLEKKNKVYYLSQPITYFKTDSNKTLKEYIENHKESFNFGMDYVIKAEKMGITLFSPSVYLCPIALERYSKFVINKESEHDLYVGIDNKFIEMMRKSGELIWIFHPKWYKSIGCIKEFGNARLHDEKCIRLEPFFNLGLEEQIDVSYYNERIDIPEKYYDMFSETIEEFYKKEYDFYCNKYSNDEDKGFYDIGKMV